MHKQPIVKLLGKDGNVFSIIARVRKALQAVGQHEQAAEYVRKAMSSGSYDAVLQLTMQYVDVY